MKLSAAAPRQWLAGPQGVEARGPDVDMSALRVLVAKPLDRLLDLDGALPFLQNHFTGVTPDAESRSCIVKLLLQERPRAQERAAVP